MWSMGQQHQDYLGTYYTMQILDTHPRPAESDLWNGNLQSLFYQTLHVIQMYPEV